MNSADPKKAIDPAAVPPQPANSAGGDVRGRSYQQTAGVLMTNITRMLRTYFDRRARTIGLTRSQWLIMNRLSLTEGITTARLAEWMEVEHITASRLIGNLEAMGWVERRTDPADRRQRLVHLTKAGMPVLEQINRLGITTEDEIFSDLTDEESALFYGMLEKIHRRMTGLVNYSE